MQDFKFHKTCLKNYFRALQICISSLRNSEVKWLPSDMPGSATQGPGPNRPARRAEGRGYSDYREKVSGVRADRPQLAKLMAAQGRRRRDRHQARLGRCTRELLELIERIGKAGASFRSLGDPLWDTSGAQGRLLSTLLAAIAEFERELIRERTGEGRRARHVRRGEVRPQAQAVGLSARRSYQAPGGGRNAGRYRQDLRRGPIMISRL